MSEAGERNKGDLLEEITEVVCLDLVVQTNDGSTNPDIKRAVAAGLGRLIHRGLLTEQALELMKAIDDGA